MFDYVLVVAVAAVVTYVTTFAVRRLAPRIGAIVMPGGRKIHGRPTPTVGGIAMVLGFAVAMAVASRIGRFHAVFSGSSEPLGVLLAGVVMAGVGLADDLRDVSAPAKVAGQVLSSSVLWVFGVTMFWFKVPFAGIVILSSSFTPLLTAIWVVAMANAINLIDGLDGLAGGVVAIASASFALYSLKLENLGQLPSSSIGPLIALLALGVCLGFLPHNFNPAKIFMGDTGAMFLGLLMAASTSVVGGRTSDVSGETFFFFAPLFIPFVILGVPMFDMAFAIIRRTARRTGVSSPDKEHLHHRLYEMGHGPRRSVVILWAWTAILSGFALTPTFTNHGNAEIPFVVLAALVLIYTMFHPNVRRRGAGSVARSTRHGQLRNRSAAELKVATRGAHSKGGRAGASGGGALGD